MFVFFSTRSHDNIPSTVISNICGYLHILFLLQYRMIVSRLPVPCLCLVNVCTC